MRYIIFAAVILLFSCTPKVAPLKNTYTTGNFEQVSENSKDKVWDNIIDFFSRNGLSIKIIDKNSGLIVSDQTRLKWSLEKKDGTLYNPDAWVALPRIQFGSSTITPSSVVGEWNVRIKEAGAGKTSVAVNLVNIRYNTVNQPLYQSFVSTTPQSTGVFERMIYDKVK